MTSTPTASKLCNDRGNTRLTIDDVYTKDRGFGIVRSDGAHERGWRTRGVQRDLRLDTFIFDGGGLTFVQDLEDGEYLLWLGSGDAQYDGVTSVTVNDRTVVPLTRTNPGGVVTVKAHQVTAEGGKLTVQVRGLGRLNYPEIVPVGVASRTGITGSCDPKQTLSVVGQPPPGAKAAAAERTIDHLLPAGEFSLDEDAFGRIVRINMNRIQRWDRVPGIKKHWALTGLDNQPACYHGVSSTLKDVDGDGTLDLFRLINSQPYGQLARLDESGRVLWKTEKLAPGCGDESGVPLEDLDGNGRYECVLSHWAAVYCIDAETGSVVWKRDLEAGGKAGPGSWDYPMVVGHFIERKRSAVVVRAGLQVHCFGADGSELWSVPLTGHTYGHELHRYDIDADGLDEIFVGRNGSTLALTGCGERLWEDTSQRNHTDFFAFGDVDADGRCEVVYDHDGCGGAGPLYVVDALSGQRERTIDYRSAGLKHAQALVCGDFRPDLPGLELACTDKLHFMLCFDSRGDVLWKRDVPTSLLACADWDGDGVLDILNFTVAVNVDGAFSVWNGQGRRLYAISWLPSPVRSHSMGCGPGLGFDGFIDTDGNARADIPVAFGPWAFGAPQNLFLMEAPADW
jgi:outer membrane protein assembly factor BamB